jgi:hypothetical protein
VPVDLELEARPGLDAPQTASPSTSTTGQPLARGAYVGVAVVALLQAMVIGWYASKSWFFVDDFLFLRQGKDSPLSLDYLRLALFEHFSPVHRLYDWLFVRVGEPNWTLAAVVLVALTVACTLAFAYLLTGVTRRTSMIVGATAVYALSLFFVRTSPWWTAGMHLMSVTLFSMLTLGGYIRWHERRRRRSLVLSVVALALALMTHEDALLLIGVLAALRLFVLSPHPRTVREIYRAFRDDLWAWASYVLLTGLAAANFVLNYWAKQPRPTPGQFVRYLWMATGEGFFSTLFLVKVPEARVFSDAATGVVATLAGCLVIGFTFLVRRGAWRPWAFFLLAFMATVVPLGLSRVAMFGATIGRDPVYQLAPAFLFLVSFAAAMEGPSREPWSQQLAAWMPKRRAWRIALTAVVCLLFGAAFLRGAHDFQGTAQADTTRHYFTNLRHDVAAAQAAGQDPQLYNPIVPPSVVPQWLIPYDRLAINLMVPDLSRRPLHPRYVVADDGHLTRVRTEKLAGGPIPTATAGASSWEATGGGACYSPVGAAGPLMVESPTPVSGDRLVVRVVGRFGQEAALTVNADGRDIPVTVVNGRGLAYLGTTSVSRLSIALPATQGCVAAVTVEELVADPL